MDINKHTVATMEINTAIEYVHGIKRRALHTEQFFEYHAMETTLYILEAMGFDSVMLDTVIIKKQPKYKPENGENHNDT